MPAPEKYELFGTDWKEIIFNLQKTRQRTSMGRVADSEATFS